MPTILSGSVILNKASTIDTSVTVHGIATTLDHELIILPAIGIAPDVETETERLRPLFAELAEEWRTATHLYGSPRRRFLHPAYQKIIGMGQPAVPLLLEELRDRPDDWFWALGAITRENPAEGQTTFDGAVEAWLAWGAARPRL
jgi:hypothetical protein